MRNRRWFIDNTPADIPPAAALMIIDFDHFKKINAHFGGEEFIVCLPQATADGLEQTARKISAGFVFRTATGSSEHVTSSVSIAQSSRSQPRAAALLLTDQAVYRAKSNGRACHVIYNGHSNCVDSFAGAAYV